MWLVRKYPPICSVLLPYGVGGPPAQIWVFGIWLIRRVAVRVARRWPLTAWAAGRWLAASSRNRCAPIRVRLLP